MIKIINGGDSTQVFSRVTPKVNVAETVANIIKDVKERGDKALLEYTLKFDKADLKCLRVTEEEIEQAVQSVEPKFMEILKRSAKNIRAFCEKQLRTGFEMTNADGAIVGQRVIPLDSAGLYVPGGTAVYPSTVLMDAIPALVSGVSRVVMVSPPDKNGKINPVILASASVAGVKEIYKVGGAQAIAGLAYGTESLPKVDKIVGPGNAFVAEAKKQVFGQVSIDMIAGPSEIMVVADGKNNPAHVSADLLSQAEHDKMASAVLITDDKDFASAVAKEIEKQIPALERAEIARASIDENGKIIVVENLERAIELANLLAPEHLELCLDNPFEYLDKIKHAGSVFLGRNCPEAMGDYIAGANHTLPTSGTARFSSALSVDDFIKKVQYVYYDKDSLKNTAKDVEYFAMKEGLTAHAKSAVIRIKDYE